MKKTKNKDNFDNLFSQFKQDLNSSYSEEKKSSYIPDIITFCEDKDWLALPYNSTNPIYLYPVQKLILKVFYRGSMGNENIKLTEKEIEICKNLGLTDHDKGNVLGKYNSKEIFQELVLVWGRRASKDFLVSLIATYEAMKLLECEGGDPYSLYELSSANSINILTVANAKDQAHIAFEEIRSKILHSPYFQDKFTKDGFTSTSIFLLTPKDKENNKKFKAKGIPLKKGSIGIIVGHSNSASLLGQGCIVLILDEVASYKMTGSDSSGDRIYTALTPTLSSYCKITYAKNKNGEFELDENNQRIVVDRRYDGKTISISSPRGKEGKFYELFSSAKDVSNRLACRLPTWKVNPFHTKESLRKQYKDMSDQEFMMEFGAEFSGLAGENFFIPSKVEECFNNKLENKKIGIPGHLYFAHLDPATTSHNYSLVVVHKEYIKDIETKQSFFIIIVDHIKYWYPKSDNPIKISEVDDYVINLKRRFRLALVTYDQMNAQESVNKLRKAGIPNKLTAFGSRYKNIIYNELELLVNSNRLFIPYHFLLKSEMLELQRKYTQTGYKVFPIKDGDGAKSDDIIDSLAGACYNAIQHNNSKLPRGQLVDFPGQSSTNNIAWRSMQGTLYGIGSGQQVSAQLEKRASWPGYKR